MRKLHSLLILSFQFLLFWQTQAQSFTGIDIWPGTGSSYPNTFVALNGKVYFSATADSISGLELWVSDGTPTGTSLVKDIWPGPGSSNPYNLTVIGNQLFFVATDSIHGYELWVSDGTSAGTMMVMDIDPGIQSSSTDYLSELNGKLYFRADDGVHGAELWVSDGTAAGTSLVKDINPGINGSSLFGVSAALPGGSSYHYGFTAFNGKLYFQADDGIDGVELWSSDGTTAGTSLVSDIWAGPGSSEPNHITVLGNAIIFSAIDSLHGNELWISDGTNAGTSLLKDIYPGIQYSDPGAFSGFTVMGGKAYFGAYIDGIGTEMWTTDGTSSGTSLVKDIWPGPSSSTPGELGFFSTGSMLYFNAIDSLNGQQLWTSDGTAAGTNLLKVLSTTTPFLSNPNQFISFNGQVIFTATVDNATGRELWISDGSAAGTHIISPPIAPNANPLNNGVDNICSNGSSVFMDANFNSIGSELWVYGFPVGITPIAGDNTITAYPNPFTTSLTLSGLESSGHYTVQIVDMTGREYYSTVLDHPAQQILVAMPVLSTGVYLMHVSGQGSTQTFKLVRN